jgi:predicted GH43/DUF377 family glycosyl hydrolase
VARNHIFSLYVNQIYVLLYKAVSYNNFFHLEPDCTCRKNKNQTYKSKYYFDEWQCHDAQINKIDQAYIFHYTHYKFVLLHAILSQEFFRDKFINGSNGAV